MNAAEKEREIYNALAAGIDDILNGREGPARIGFVLLVAEFGKIEGGRVNYVSNAEKSDMLAMMKEYIARVEGRHVEAPEAKQ